MPTMAAEGLAETCCAAVSSAALRVFVRRVFGEQQCAASARYPVGDLDAPVRCVAANLALRAPCHVCHIASCQKCRHALILSHMRQTTQERHAVSYCDNWRIWVIVSP